MILVRSRAFVLMMMIVALASCGDDGSCPSDTPMCPTTNPPSYVNDVAPIMQSRCVECHAPGGVEAVTPLTNYSQVSGDAQSVYDQVFCNSMPQNGPLTSNQRTLVLEWVLCGAQNN